MICPKCGATIRDGIKFCSACGAPQTVTTASNPQPIEQQQQWQEYAQPSAEPQQRWQEPPKVNVTQQPAYAPVQSVNANPMMNANQLPPQYKPLSAWAYFGYSILYSIPIIGFIILIVNALNDSNINRRNHARSFFCGLVLLLIVGIITAILSAVLGFSIADTIRYGF